MKNENVADPEQDAVVKVLLYLRESYLGKIPLDWPATLYQQTRVTNMFRMTVSPSTRRKGIQAHKLTLNRKSTPYMLSLPLSEPGSSMYGWTISRTCDQFLTSMPVTLQKLDRHGEIRRRNPSHPYNKLFVS